MLYLIKIKRGVIMQAFIFDMDGVIIDSEPIHNKVVKEVLLENNIVVDDEEFNKLIGMTSTSVFSYFIDKHHLPYTPEEMTNNHMNFFKKYIVDHNLKPIDGICPLLEQLQKANIPLAIASSSPLNVIEFVVKTFNIDKYFKFLISGEDILHSKPAPDIYLKTAKNYKLTLKIVSFLKTLKTVALRPKMLACIVSVLPILILAIKIYLEPILSLNKYPI